MMQTLLNRISLGLVSLAVIATTSLALPTTAWAMGERPVITNPDEPGFDPMEFRFEHYGKSKGNLAQLMPALLTMFPPGTEKQYIDRILVDRGGLEIAPNPLSSKPNPGDYGYRWSTHGGLAGHVVRVIYNKNYQSIHMSLNGARLYGRNKYMSASKREHMQALKPQNLIQMEQERENRLRILREKYLGLSNGDVDENNPNRRGGRL